MPQLPMQACNALATHITSTCGVFVFVLCDWFVLVHTQSKFNEPNDAGTWQKTLYVANKDGEQAHPLCPSTQRRDFHFALPACNLLLQLEHLCFLADVVQHLHTTRSGVSNTHREARHTTPAW